MSVKQVMSLSSVMGVMPVEQLASLEAPLVLADYGMKTFGYLELIQMQPGSPVPYRVPTAWAIPRLSTGVFGKRDIAAVFDALTQPLPDEAVLMARSSAVDEQPGENPTLFSVFERSDIAGSRNRFYRSCPDLRS